MPASQGTPTVWEKLQALFNQNSTDPTVQATLAGIKADFTKGQKAVLTLLGPTITTAETDVQGDLATFLQNFAASIPQITSLSHFGEMVSAALAAEKGPLQKQAIAIGQSALTTLSSAALTAAGKVNLPLVG